MGAGTLACPRGKLHAVAVLSSRGGLSRPPLFQRGIPVLNRLGGRGETRVEDENVLAEEAVAPKYKKRVLQNPSVPSAPEMTLLIPESAVR